MVVVLFAAIWECDIKMNSGLNDNNGIQFADQKNNNPLKYRSDATTRAKMKILPVFRHHREFRGGLTSEGSREGRH